jgi:hypothetical protein
MCESPELFATEFTEIDEKRLYASFFPLCSLWLYLFLQKVISLSRKEHGMPIDYLPLLPVSRDRVNYNEKKRKPPSAS